ncbi:Methyl-accepting chemotaxis sensor/transducer protein [hydrothermal vent metagenome]|uniref:Methyl-accepting chemotaxis sensor/transducer protein n=1 Tax=hydrothermal vent metagenome TaxID=652676 RepID=A0A3B1A0W8_9ZZZZ
MAPRKKAKMGADPLAWMQDNDTSPVKIVTSKPVERRKNPRSKKNVSGLDVALLEKTFAALVPQGEALVKRFYEELFERYPDVKPMFDNTTVADQEKKLLAALQLVVNSLRKPEALANTLAHLGRKHHEYGARPEHYTAVVETLLGVMAEFAGELWTDDVHAAWSRALNTVATTMLAVKKTDNTGEEDKTMVANKKVVNEKLQEDLQEKTETTRMSSAINNAMTPIMMVDRDLMVTYVNKATIDLLKKHETTMQSVYAGFSADNLVGMNIDTFHKNPEHQRKLLSDPKNLPYQTDIAVGPLKFSLNVTAQIDATGNYIGTTLEWSDVTELRAKESDVTRLQGTVDGAMTAMMMVDRDLVITYANDSTVKLLKKHEAALAAVYPGFSVDKIVGTCIDTFHKNPEHQRKLLADPANLPYQTDIAIGDLKFALNVTAIVDAEGHYVGNALEWSDVTELRAKESAVTRLQGTVDGAMTAMMMVDRDLVITYANDSTVKLLKKHEATLAAVYPGFSADKIVDTCIDVFHKQPEHQRKLLADPANLPYQTDIAIGDLRFSLNVTAIMDAEGHYVGNALEWSDVTDLRHKEAVNADFASQIAAIGRSQAVIEFNMDGTIIQANDNFLNTLGYSLDEIQGKHHRIFVEPEYAQSPEYARFWEKLNAGEYEAARYKRIGKGGKEIWIEASYNPIFDVNGKPFKVVKYATDVTESMRREADHSAQIDAIRKSQAVIEFNMDGTIIQANDNFLNTVGYSLDEVQGKHHRMFVEHDYAQSVEYTQFWENLSTGKFAAARYKRLGKGGREIWIQASYNPIFNLNGKPFKVVKYATDVTVEVEKEREVARLKSAVDGAQTNFMICDADLNITYCNPAVVGVMRARQHELSQVWPGFDPNKLVGSNIDVFHKNPTHQRALLSDPNRLPIKTEIKAAGLEFEVNATIIQGANGEYLGNMVEWRDVTEQKDAVRQIQSLIDDAVQGQLKNRIATDQFDGFLLSLGEGINRLMDAVVEPVEETRRVISGLAEGDLTQSMNGEFEGEFAELRDAVNSTMNKLLSMVNEIGTASGTIASAANEISQGTADLSQRSEEQASSLEETASSMEELTGTVRQNADNAREANQLANSARDEATKGGEVVGKAITAMAEINQSSKKIADIIGVIDEIAFQTNLLALNAAVEAARAGEQGRGFAVVAAEVRNLAQRSASAAKEIKSLINDSVEKVTEGSKLVDQSGATLEEIVGSVKKVSDIIAEIASAGQEQASGIDQINKAVTQMDEMTQQNAALVEEAAASSEAMNDQAVALDDLIGFFKTGENTRRPAASAQHTTRPAAASPASARRPAPKDNGGSEWEEF